MQSSRALFRFVSVAAALACAVPVLASAQEIGPFIGGGVGGIRDVRRPFGGGLSATLLFHDWIGVRADAGYYWTLEHRTGLYCLPKVNEGGARCFTAELASNSNFPLLDGLAVLRAHIPNKGVRFEVGAGPTWVNVNTRIRTVSDTFPETRVQSSRAGLMLMAGLLAHPQWRIPVTLEGSYVYHMTGAFGACLTPVAGDPNPSRLNDPLCTQHLNFHELRFALLYRLRGTP
jgi:hypothetical protein